MRFAFLLLFALISAGQASSQEATKAWRWLVPPQFENAHGFSEGLAPVKVGDYWGFIDRTGKMAIKPQFNPKQPQYNSYFSEGLAAVNFSEGGAGEWGFIDKSGKVVINPQFRGDYYSPPLFREGLACISVEGGKVGFIDKTGKMVIPPEFYGSLRFSDGLSVVQIDGKQGYINKKGQLALPAIYETAFPFSNGMAVVVIDGKSAIINREGQVILAPQDKNFYSFSEGLAAFTVAKPTEKLPSETIAKFGFMNTKGEVIILPQFNDTVWNLLSSEFSEGLALVKFGETLAGKYGYINRSGRLVINPLFDHANGFKEGLAAVEKDRKYGYIDMKGNVVVPFVFDSADSFVDGVALVAVNGKYGYIILQSKQRTFTSIRHEHVLLYRRCNQLPGTGQNLASFPVLSFTYGQCAMT